MLDSPCVFSACKVFANCKNVKNKNTDCERYKQAYCANISFIAKTVVDMKIN